MTVALERITRDQLLALGAGTAPSDLFDTPVRSNPHGVLVGEDIPHANRVADVQANPSNIVWYYRLIVVESRIVGSTSFHAAPDSDGMLEIGLGIAEPERGHGFATEAVTQMWDWAVQQSGVSTLRYTVSPDNAPSQAIIAKFPAVHMGVQIDDEDGPEDIYEVSAQGWRDFRRGARPGPKQP